MTLTAEELVELDSLLIAETPILPHVLYQSDPVGWAVDKLGVPEHTLRWSQLAAYQSHTWDGDVDPLAKAFDAIRDFVTKRLHAAERGAGGNRLMSIHRAHAYEQVLDELDSLEKQVIAADAKPVVDQPLSSVYP